MGAFDSVSVSDDASVLIGFAIAVSTFVAPAFVFALLFLRRSQNAVDPWSGWASVFNVAAQMQVKFLAIGSVMDEPWQLLHHMRNAPNPMAVKTNLIRYLISSMQSHISRSRQIARMSFAKSYGDLNLVGKLVLGFAHLGSLLLFAGLIIIIIKMPRNWNDEIVALSVSLFECVVWSCVVLLFVRWLGADFYSAFFAPLRWCAYRVGAIRGIFREIATYIVRSRGWSVVLAIAMGLEGYRHQLPLIEQFPSGVPGNFVKYENIPADAEQRALAIRGAWIDRHLNNVAQTFSKLLVTSADIALLLHAIEADQTLVHAAYYTDDECIARIADWIAGRG